MYTRLWTLRCSRRSLTRSTRRPGRVWCSSPTRRRPLRCSNGLSSSAELQKLGFFVVDGSKAAALSSSFDVAKLPSIVVVEKDSVRGFGEGRRLHWQHGVHGDCYVLEGSCQRWGWCILCGGGEGSWFPKAQRKRLARRRSPSSPLPRSLPSPFAPLPCPPRASSRTAGQGSLKIRQQQPLCVISFRKGASMDALHKKLEDSGPSCFWMAPARILGITSRTRSNGARTWRALAMMSTRATWCCCERSVSLLPRCWFCRLRRMRASRRH